MSMSILDEHQKKKAFFVLLSIAVLLLAISFIAGYFAGHSDKANPIIIQKTSDGGGLK